jgi:acyl carrier protein
MTIKKEIKLFILQNFLFTSEDTALDNADSLMKKGIVDSTGILEIIMHLESSYGIKVLDEEMVPANLDSVDNIVAYVERKRSS